VFALAIHQLVVGNAHGPGQRAGTAFKTSGLAPDIQHHFMHDIIGIMAITEATGDKGKQAWLPQPVQLLHRRFLAAGNGLQQCSFRFAVVVTHRFLPQGVPSKRTGLLPTGSPSAPSATTRQRYSRPGSNLSRASDESAAVRVSASSNIPLSGPRARACAMTA